MSTRRCAPPSTTSSPPCRRVCLDPSFRTIPAKAGAHFSDRSRPSPGWYGSGFAPVALTAHIFGKMSTLFQSQAPHPLADRLRPRKLGDIVGQDHLLGPDGPIGRMVASKRLASVILWGPPGCGKTTIARLLAEGTDLAFEPLSAVFSGVADLRKVFDAAKKRREMGQGTLLFVDESHHFNRAHQDAFLPYVEDGTVILVGATTETPSFELIGALLSRAQVFVLRRLDDSALETLLARAEKHLGHLMPLTDDGRAALRAMADGDGRFLLNLVEEIDRLPREPALGPQQLAELGHRRAPLYDKQQDG